MKASEDTSLPGARDDGTAYADFIAATPEAHYAGLLAVLELADCVLQAHPDRAAMLAYQEPVPEASRRHLEVLRARAQRIQPLPGA